MTEGEVKIAEDSDFDLLKNLIDNHNDWRLDYDKGKDVKVWTKSTNTSSFRMVKLHSVFHNVSASTLYDVLHDPEYRKEWDKHMIESVQIGYLNPNNDISYYAISCPAPVKNRDFVLQRSWLDLGEEKLIINHSVEHKAYPPRKNFVRGFSHLTGYVVRPLENGCFLGYVAQTDPKGSLPTWLVNKISEKFVPNVVKQLKNASYGYENWKSLQEEPNMKPWIYPEYTLNSPRVRVEDCILGTLTIN